MAEHDYVIANDTAAQVRADINNALSAIVSNNSKSSEPSTTFAYMWWYDTTTNILKIRNSADDAWISVANFDQTNDQVDKLYVRSLISLLADNTCDLGSSSNALKDLYMQGDLYFDNDNSHTQNHYTWVPIITKTASASANIDFTLDNTNYDSHRFVFNRLQVATNAANVNILHSTDGGSTFKTGASDYHSAAYWLDANDTVTQVLGQTTGNGILIARAARNGTNGGIYGHCEVLGAGLTKYTMVVNSITFEQSLSALACRQSSGGMVNIVEDTDAVRFIASSGNLDAGTITQYGKKIIA